MAVLTETERQQVWRGLMRYWSNEQEPVTGITKQDLRDAIDNTDVWIDDHEGNTGDTTGYNGALPATFKSNATAAQKTVLFCAVASRRVSKAFAIKLFGDLD